MLEVPKLTAGAQHAADFAERNPLIWHRARRETGDHGIVVAVPAGDVFGRAGHDLDLGTCLPSCGAGPGCADVGSTAIRRVTLAG